MAEIKRYELAEVGTPYQPWWGMQPAKDGAWVDYDDHEKAVADLGAEIERLREQVVVLEGRLEDASWDAMGDDL